MRGRTRILWPLVALALLLGACGIGAESSPHVIPDQQVPYHLLQPTTTTTQVGGPAEYATVYLAGSQHLVAVSRLVREPVSTDTVLAALARGPTTAEATNGLRSPISIATPLSVASVNGDLVTVRLSNAFANLAGHDQIVAAAQLVYTLTAIPGIDDVRIDIDGHPVQVPTADGNLKRGPLTRADYASLAAL